MDVSIQEWPEHVQTILKLISNAHLVSLDFELSGISMKSTHRKAEIRSNLQKQTLQHRYSEVKTAAEKYQILQVGITVVEQDEQNACYVLRPYNIHVSPIVKQQLAVERELCLQSSCVDFLVQHHFDFQKCIAGGVPYLSREEEVQLRAEETTPTHMDGSRGIPLHEMPHGIPHADFLIDVRAKIVDWLQDTNGENFINISSPASNISAQLHGRMGQAEKRLLQDLVKMDFPNLVTESFARYVQVRQLDIVKDASIATYRKSVFETKIQSQTGLRYLMDALTAGSDMNNVDPIKWTTPTSAPKWHSSVEQAIEDFERLKAQLKQPTILAGHNIFVDLVNFYACFIGKLPDDVHDFARKMHKMFPFVIDTKYLATHLNNQCGTRSGLEDLHSDLKNTTVPRIFCRADHSRYDSTKDFSHEAGYDSYMTARIAIRLSAKLEAMEKVAAQKSAKESKTSAVRGPLVPKLPSEELEEIFSGENCSVKGLPWSFEDIENLKISGLMPAFDSGFWGTYGNRLRVNGTVEGMLTLGEWDISHLSCSGSKQS